MMNRCVIKGRNISICEKNNLCTADNPCHCVVIDDDITELFTEQEFDLKYSELCDVDSKCFLRFSPFIINEVSCPSINNPGADYVGDLFWVFVIVVTIFLLLVSLSTYVTFNRLRK